VEGLGPDPEPVGRAIEVPLPLDMAAVGAEAAMVEVMLAALPVYWPDMVTVLTR
jgi:hypothetical protein